MSRNQCWPKSGRFENIVLETLTAHNTFICVDHKHISVNEVLCFSYTNSIKIIVCRKLKWYFCHTSFSISCITYGSWDDVTMYDSLDAVKMFGSFDDVIMYGSCDDAILYDLWDVDIMYDALDDVIMYYISCIWLMG